MSSAHLADMADAGVIVVPGDNPWTLPASYVARVLYKAPNTVRGWCASGWYHNGQLMAKKIGSEWMVHGPRFTAYLAEETP